MYSIHRLNHPKRLFKLANTRHLYTKVALSHTTEPDCALIPAHNVGDNYALSEIGYVILLCFIVILIAMCFLRRFTRKGKLYVHAILLDWSFVFQMCLSFQNVLYYTNIILVKSGYVEGNTKKRQFLAPSK